MSTILVTGASGFVGSRLAERLGGRHEVVALSRRAVAGGVAHSYRGDFGAVEDLRQLDAHRIEAVVHLGAEMGGTSEEAAFAVNVAGTRRLLRYLVDQGCRKFVLASSIAAAGCLSPEFVPDMLPMPSRHRCLARDAYGLSKHIMEGVADYFGRLHADAEFISLRIGAILESNDPLPGLVSATAPPALPFLSFGAVGIADVLAALQLAVEAERLPGARVYNLVGPDLRSADVAADVLRAALGDRAAQLDLSPYERPGHRAPPVYEMAEIAADLGFVPGHSVARP